MDWAQNRFTRKLLGWYDKNRRDLPWRLPRGAAANCRPDPYHVLVSETMLQQTQVRTVIPYFRRFLERFPTIQSLGASDEQEVLRLWDESTEKINRLWPQIPAERFQETVTAFGQYPGRVYELLFYAIDNEIHHRGQGYVYLRALGIAPPPFYERS